MDQKPSNAQEPPLILAVDDLRENTQILEDFLRPKGYRVSSVDNGRDALRFVAEFPRT